MIMMITMTMLIDQTMMTKFFKAEVHGDIVMKLIGTFFEGPPMFTGTLSYNMIQDDHLPFYNLGLRFLFRFYCECVHEDIPG